MGKTLDCYRAARDGDMVGGRYEVEGVVLKCPVCGCEIFEDRRAVVGTRFLSFLKLEWLNRGAWILDCAKCGHLSWFSKRPTELSDRGDVGFEECRSDLTPDGFVEG